MTQSEFNHLARCSRFGHRLLAAQPQLVEAAAGQLGQACTREAMQAFLARAAVSQTKRRCSSGCGNYASGSGSLPPRAIWPGRLIWPKS